MKNELLERVVIDPPEAPAAVVIWLHGLGADGHDFEPLVPELKLPPEIPVRFVFPHAPLRAVTINFGMVMRAWYDILEADVSRRVDLDSLLASVDRLRDLIRAEQQEGIPSQRIVLAGFSQGGAVALHTALRYEQPLAGLIALSTYMPTAPSLAAERHSANQAIPVFMGHGRFDPLIAMNLGLESRRQLSRLGYAVQWHDYPMQHEVCADEIAHLGAWLRQILGDSVPGLPPA